MAITLNPQFFEGFFFFSIKNEFQHNKINFLHKLNTAWNSKGNSLTYMVRKKVTELFKVQKAFFLQKPIYLLLETTRRSDRSI